MNLLYKAKGVKIHDGQHLQPEVQEKRWAQRGCTCEKRRAQVVGKMLLQDRWRQTLPKKKAVKAEGRLEKGRILEDGTFDELIALNGKFAELVKRQRLEN